MLRVLKSTGRGLAIILIHCLPWVLGFGVLFVAYKFLGWIMDMLERGVWWPIASLGALVFLGIAYLIGDSDDEA